MAKRRSISITSESLRLHAHSSAANTELAIPPGEYEGPFVIDRPMRLVGGGAEPEMTTLWVRHGPAVIVRSQGVVIHNVNVEVTFEESRQNAATLWYAPGCEPEMRGCKVRGRIEQMDNKKRNQGGWSLPDLIDLGDLRANYQVTLPMMMRVPGPTRIRTGMSGLHVQPDRLPGPGVYLIRVGFPPDVLRKDFLLAGQLLVTSGDTTHPIWVIGRVLGEDFGWDQWVKDTLILVGAKSHRYGFSVGMSLGKEVLRNEPGADVLTDQQALIQREPSGTWCLIEPLPVVIPTLVDGKPVGMGRRRLLKGGELIEVGSVKLKVEIPKKDLPIDADGVVDFGKLSVQRSRGPKMVTINSKQRPKWKGVLRSTVSWITIPSPDVECPGNQSVQLPVQLGTDMRGLPLEKVTTNTGALVLEGDKESWVMSAKLDVDVEDSIEVNPSMLDFGQVSDPAASPVLDFYVRNLSQKDWQGTVTVEVQWLAVSDAHIRCAPGEQVRVQVALNDNILGLLEGERLNANAITVQGPDIKFDVGVRFYFDKPVAALEIRPLSLDWGKVVNWRSAPAKKVQIVNSGTKDWQGTVEVKVPWLTVMPTILQCPVNGRATLAIELNDQVENLTTGIHKEPIALQLLGDNMGVPVMAQLEVDVPPVQVDTDVLEYTIDGPAEIPIHTVRIRNPGSSEWRGTIEHIRWLEVSPTQIVCPAKGEVSVTVTLGSDASHFRKRRTLMVDDALKIKSVGALLLVGVRLIVERPLIGEVRTVSIPSPAAVPAPVAPPPRPKPQDAPPPPAAKRPPKRPSVRQDSGIEVTFGTVEYDSGSLPTMDIELDNSDTAVMNGEVRSNVPWLSVSPATFSVPPKQSMRISVSLTDQIKRMKAKPYDVADALLIFADGEEYTVRASMILVKRMSPWERQPVEPQGLSVDFGTIMDFSGLLPTQKLQLENPEARYMQGTIQSTVPWLDVIPTSFSCPSNGSVTLDVLLTNRVKQLRPKLYDVPDGLIIDVEGEKHPVNVRLRVDKFMSDRGSQPMPLSEPSPAASPPKQPTARPSLTGQITIQPEIVDLGITSRHSSTIQQITLHNGLNNPWQGTVESTVPWLHVSAETIHCPAGESITVQVEFSLRGGIRLRPKTYEVADAIIFKEANTPKFWVGVRMNFSR